jgi:hypothetical protein
MDSFTWDYYGCPKLPQKMSQPLIKEYFTPLRQINRMRQFLITDYIPHVEANQSDNEMEMIGLI